MKIIPIFFFNTPSQYKKHIVTKNVTKKFPSGYKYKFKKKLYNLD